MAEMHGPPYCAAIIDNETGIVLNTTAIGDPGDVDIFQEIFQSMGQSLVDCKGVAFIGCHYNFETGIYTEPEGDS